MADLPGVTMRDTLARPELHQKWIEDYRGAENEPFMELAFDEISRYLKGQRSGSGGAKSDWLLDAGCGTGKHTVRLAKLGFSVYAIDFSEHALKQAEEYAVAQLPDERVRRETLQFGRESLLELSFPDARFQYVFCWGVLMHIPEIEKAVRELARVVRPGGWIIIGENNLHSLEWTLYRLLQRHTSRSIRQTPAGLESTWEHAAGTIFVRLQNIPWLVRAFAAEGLVLRRRIARQFSEAYTKVSSSKIRRLIHWFNNGYFRYGRLPYPASGNLLFFQKPREGTDVA